MENEKNSKPLWFLIQLCQRSKPQFIPQQRDPSQLLYNTFNFLYQLWRVLIQRIQYNMQGGEHDFLFRTHRTIFTLLLLGRGRHDDGIGWCHDFLTDRIDSVGGVTGHGLLTFVVCCVLVGSQDSCTLQNVKKNVRYKKLTIESFCL